MQEENFYIEYKIGDANRNEKLETLFLKLKDEKEKYFQTGTEPSSEIEYWIEYLDSDAIKWFNKIELKPNSERRKVYDKLWKLTKPAIRLKHPMFNTADNWSLDSMIYVIFQGDYELTKIEKSNNKGILY